MRSEITGQENSSFVRLRLRGVLHQIEAHLNIPTRQHSLQPRRDIAAGTSAEKKKSAAALFKVSLNLRQFFRLKKPFRAGANEQAAALGNVHRQEGIKRSYTNIIVFQQAGKAAVTAIFIPDRTLFAMSLKKIGIYRLGLHHVYDGQRKKLFALESGPLDFVIRIHPKLR